ncbi:unnamed protein product [Diabrotica balteata]|uniref:Transcription factor Adf-1 n=1 Tax=Diabrotica balteata TaxID=107213 RepID=A0A9N9X8Q8_DIABA|nr:unnamed protein product [Diabrotica balteata]
MDDEKLIELVRKYPVIYDNSNSKYLYTKHKLEIWKKIGEEMQQTSSACKSRWQNIRDQFRKNLAKNVTKSGQAAEKRKKYKYEDCLQFIIPFFAKIDNLSNVQSSESDAPVNTINEETEDEGSQLQPTTEILETSTPTEAENQPRPVIKTPSGRMKNKLCEHESDSTTLMKYIIARENSHNTENVHPIDAFFSGLAATVKLFSPYYQHLAKGRLFQVVQDLEEQQLLGPIVQNNEYHVQPLSTASPAGTSLDYTHMSSMPTLSPDGTSLDSTHTIHEFKIFEANKDTLNESKCSSELVNSKPLT